MAIVLFIGVLIVFWSVDNRVQDIGSVYQTRLNRLRQKRFAAQSVNNEVRPAMRRIQQFNNGFGGFPEGFSVGGVDLVIFSTQKLLLFF